MGDVDAIVIGAGCGGLTAGALLAGQGRRVVVLEQSGSVGGCASSFRRDGYTFDVGASIFEVLDPLRRVFAALGTTIEDELDLIRCDPTLVALLRDGTRLTFPACEEGVADVFGRISAEDAENWSRFASYCSDLYSVLLDTVYREPVSTVGDLVRIFRRRPALARYVPAFLTSYQGALGRFFTKRARESFAFQAVTMGLPPELLPGLYAFLPYGELRGIYYPRGGMIQIPKALQRVGERHGMAVQLHARVRRVLIEGRRAIGVVLEDGTEIRSAIVVSDINAKTLYLGLIGEEHLPPTVRRGVRSYRYDNALPVVFLGLDRPPALEAHHTFVQPTLDEVNAWWRDRGRRPIPRRQAGMIDWPTFTDPSLAPEGRHVLNVLMTGSYGGVDWDAHKRPFIDDVIDHLSRTAVPGLTEHVVLADVATPLDFERRIGLGQGGLHGIVQDLAHSTIFRPSNKSKSIDGLYLVGSSTNPGGGVPTVIASGSITAGLVDEHEGG